MDEAIKVYPTVEELSSISSKVTCSQADCKAVFKSSSNLNMHLLKHHKIAADVLSKKSRTCEYYCPIKMCIYHRNSKKCFDKLKYLKQHFLKVHAAKKYECSTCGKRFSTESFRNLHVKSCGKFLSCTCGATYNSSEAMLTHCKRKGAGHSLVKKDDSTPKRPVNLEENVSNCGTCESKSNRLIYPKLDKNFPIHYIAAIALSELSIPCNLSRAKSVAVQTDVQGEGTMVTFKLENKKRKSSRQTQTTAGKNKNLKISAETQTIGDYMKNKQRHYPKLTSKKRKKSMETQTREHGKLIVPSLKMGKGKVNMDVRIEGIPGSNLTRDGKWFWDEKPKNSTSTTVSSISVVPRADKTSGKSELLQELNFSKKELFSDLNRFNEPFKSKSSVFYPNNTGVATDQQMFDINRLCNIETQTEMDSFLTECGEDTSFTLCSTTETQTTDDFDSLLYSNMCTQTSEDVDQLFDFNFVDIETQTAWPDLSD